MEVDDERRKNQPATRDIREFREEQRKYHWHTWIEGIVIQHKDELTAVSNHRMYGGIINETGYVRPAFACDFGSDGTNIAR